MSKEEYPGDPAFGLVLLWVGVEKGADATRGQERQEKMPPNAPCRHQIAEMAKRWNAPAEPKHRQEHGDKSADGLESALPVASRCRAPWGQPSTPSSPRQADSNIFITLKDGPGPADGENDCDGRNIVPYKRRSRDLDQLITRSLTAIAKVSSLRQ